MSLVAVHLIVKGKVQGVFYRKSTRKQALELNLKGWVRNMDNGDVEIEAEGDEKTIREFIQWCTKGPEKAHVTEVLEEWVPLKGFSDFNIK